MLRQLTGDTKMTYASKTHSYHGATIEPCEMADASEHGGRWVVRGTDHGMRVFCSQSSHYGTLASAKAAIDEQREHDAISNA